MAIPDMPPAFLREIAPNAEVEAKLRALGASSPTALLSMIKASNGAFASYLGSRAADIVEERLQSLVPVSGMTDPISSPRAFGAFSKRAPETLRSPPYDVAERDSVWTRLQNLKRTGASKQEINKAQTAFNKLVNNH